MRPAIVIFAVAVVAQWFIPLAGIRQHERVIARGVPLRIRCTAPDPYDPFRGRYLAVRPEQTEYPGPEGMPKRGAVPVWATLEADADGLSTIGSLSLEPVTGPTVVRLTAWKNGWKAGDEAVRVEWPFDRLYLNERLAPDADRIVAERFRTEKKPVADIRVLDGRVVLVDLLVDGESIRDLVRRRKD